MKDYNDVFDAIAHEDVAAGATQRGVSIDCGQDEICHTLGRSAEGTATVSRRPDGAMVSSGERTTAEFNAEKQFAIFLSNIYDITRSEREQSGDASGYVNAAIRVKD